MRIFVNGEARDIARTTLELTLNELGFGGRKVATAVNGRFVPAPRRATTRLVDGDRLEIVAPMQGG